MTANDDSVSFQAMENVLKLDRDEVVQLPEYAVMIKLYTLSR